MNRKNKITNRERSAYATQAAADFMERIFNLKILLDKDLYGCDAKWTLFVSAALSYRYDFLLNPCPPKFMTGQRVNIDELLIVINEVPPLRMILSNITEENYGELDPDVIELLHWVLVSKRHSRLRSVSPEEYDIIIAKTNDSERPTHIFEVVPGRDSNLEEKFHRQILTYDTNIGFHGSKLMNFYSILNNGVHQYICKNGQCGDGIYLTTKLSVSRNDSPNSAAWGASLCGTHISCIAMCEYVSNPDYAKIHTRIHTEDEEPQRYIVVTNNEAVRVRYLMFYGLDIRNEFSPRKLAVAWVNSNKCLLTVFCYTFLLASIGFANSGSGLYIREVISKTSSDIIELFKNFFSEDNQ